MIVWTDVIINVQDQVPDIWPASQTIYTTGIPGILLHAWLLQRPQNTVIFSSLNQFQVKCEKSSFLKISFQSLLYFK